MTQTEALARYKDGLLIDWIEDRETFIAAMRALPMPERIRATVQLARIMREFDEINEVGELNEFLDAMIELFD